MTFRPDIHHRRNLRLLEYDYSAEGLYFITICTHERKPLFGKIEEDEMLLNGTGQIIEQQYHLLEQRFPHIQCLEHVVMPNHFHCIIRITDNYVGAPLCGCPEYIRQIIRAPARGAPTTCYNRRNRGRFQIHHYQ